MKEKIFEQLIDESLPMLRGIAYRILNNTVDADDAVQEALLQAWKKFDSFESRAKLSSWVCRITVNVSYDILRKKKSEKNKCPDAECMEESYEEPDRERIEVLKEAIFELPEIFRDAVTAIFFGGLSGEEAAKMQNCNVNTFYWRVNRAKELLYEKLKGY